MILGIMRVYLTDQLDDSTGVLNLFLGLCGEVSGANDEWDFWETTLSEDLGVTEGELFKD